MAQTLGKKSSKNLQRLHLYPIYSIEIALCCHESASPQVALAMEISGTRMTVNEWPGMVQRVREMIVCEKINDALASVKALEDGMTEYLDEDRDDYFNPPASSFHDVRNELRIYGVVSLFFFLSCFSFVLRPEVWQCGRAVSQAQRCHLENNASSWCASAPSTVYGLFYCLQ